MAAASVPVSETLAGGEAESNNSNACSAAAAMAVEPPVVTIDAGWPAYREVKVTNWQGGRQQSRFDHVAEEVPVALVYNGIPHVVMMATPQDLEDFAYGFSITEGIIGAPQEIHSVRIFNRAEGIEVRIRIPEAREGGLAKSERNLTGRTGCGICGAATLRQAVRHPPPVAAGMRVAAAELQTALQNMQAYQTINSLTGAIHAAAWVVPGQGILNVREDVGRHNALDKLIGALAKMHSDFSAGFIIVTSRASYEMVQKTASAGVAMLAAISAPTALAIRLANEAGITLVGFARGDKHAVYTNPQRLLHNNNSA